MGRSTRVTILAAALAFAAAGPPAQEAPRRATAGRVLDADGRPLAGARVRYAYVPLGGEHLPPADVVEAVTDARGRYRVALLPCAQYQAWAIGEADADGRRLVSAMGWTDASEVLDTPAHHEFVPQRIEVKGIDAWAADGPHRVRWLTNGIELPMPPVAVDADGMTDVPPTPAGLCTGEVLDARGEVFATFTHSTARPRTSVRIDPPREIPMRATDEQGRPVAGAVVWQRVVSAYGHGDPLTPHPTNRYVWRRVGETDGDGRLVGRVASRVDPFETGGWHRITLLAKKPGYAACHSGFLRKPFCGGKELEHEGLDTLPFVMHPARPYRGRVRGATAAGHPIRVLVESHIQYLDGKGWIHDRLGWTVVPDAEGRFEIAEMPANAKVGYFLAQPHAAGLAAFPAALRRSVPPQPLALHPRQLARDEDEVLDIGAARVVRVQILDERSGPTRDTRLMIVSRGGDSVHCDWRTPRVAPDRAGRVALRLEPGQWLLFARDRTAMAWAVIDPAEQQELTLRLTPMPAMRGRVVDANGNPVANAALDCHSSSHRFVREKQVLEPIASAMNYRWIDSVRTDADGNFHCAFIDMPHMTYTARFTFGDRKSGDFEIVASDEPETITIR